MGIANGASRRLGRSFSTKKSLLEWPVALWRREARRGFRRPRPMNRESVTWFPGRAPRARESAFWFRERASRAESDAPGIENDAFAIVRGTFGLRRATVRLRAAASRLRGASLTKPGDASAIPKATSAAAVTLLVSRTTLSSLERAAGDSRKSPSGANWGAVNRISTAVARGDASSARRRPQLTALLLPCRENVTQSIDMRFMKAPHRSLCAFLARSSASPARKTALAPSSLPTATWHMPSIS